MQFINRENELKFLEEQYKKNNSNFIVVYGRRRTGKTSLIREFIKNKPNIYFLSDIQTEIEQLLDLQETAADFFAQDELLKNKTFKTWDSFLRYLTDKIKKQDKKIILVIDEYTYLYQSNKAISSILQKYWDKEWHNSGKVFLILCGSLVGMMAKLTLYHSAPLYGRNTGQIKLKPFNFTQFCYFFPKISLEKQIELYAILGGTPRYILESNRSNSLWQNIREKFLRTESILYQDPISVLSQEVATTGTYFSLLKTIAFGEHKISKIGAKLEMKATQLNPYLEKLIDLDLIEKRVPITEKPHKSKMGLYFLKDNFFKFWFKFIFANRSFVEKGDQETVLKQIKKEFSQFVSLTFEDIIRESVLNFQHIGSWWSKDEEIDIIGLNPEKDEILFGEVKWQNRLVGTKVLLDLKRKSRLVKWGTKTRKESFLLASKSGFEKALRETAEKETIVLIDLNNFKV
jgi:AAA+ ATPase superfamily predicted ATPase